MNYWPPPYQGAISITFDDGMRSQLDLAVPALEEHDIKATFYLNPRSATIKPNQKDTTWRETLAPWVEISKSGHEIGNHTIRHPCSLNVHTEWQEGNNLINFSLEDIRADIQNAQARINEVFPNQAETSFAYPCYESAVGRGVNRVSYTPIVAKEFVAARARGELRGDLANDPMFCDLHHLSSWAVERQTGAFMIGLVELALANHRWGIFTFHGIQEGHLPVGITDFIELLDHLVRRRNEVWVAPVATIGKYIASNIQVNSEMPS